MRDIQRAKELLALEGYTCVLCRDDATYTSRERGVKPLINLLDGGKISAGFSAADKVVGRAAAFLYVLLGVRELYAAVISDTAMEVLNRYAVKVSFDTKTDTILNRSQTGLCPMESTVLDINEPAAALTALRERVRSMQG